MTGNWASVKSSKIATLWHTKIASLLEECRWVWWSCHWWSMGCQSGHCQALIAQGALDAFHSFHSQQRPAKLPKACITLPFSSCFFTVEPIWINLSHPVTVVLLIEQVKGWLQKGWFWLLLVLLWLPLTLACKVIWWPSNCDAIWEAITAIM